MSESHLGSASPLNSPEPWTEGFWEAVRVAEPVLTSPRIPELWGQGSALAEMSVGDLAAHLVRAVTTVVSYLSQPAPLGQPISAAAYYLAIIDDPTDLTSSQNTAVRQRARSEAAAGAQEVLRRWEGAVTEAGRALAHASQDRLVTVAGGLVLTLDQYLATRVVELLVHTDDLAVSIGIATPRLPPAAAKLAEHVLLDVARERHGDIAVLRALTRRERSSSEVLRVL